MNSSLRLDAYGASDIGGRSENEDAFIISDPVFVVADGMGGNPASGAWASAMAVAAVANAFHRAHAISFEGKLKAAVNEAARVIDATIAKNPTLLGTGATLVALAFVANEACVVHVGDARCYVFRGGQLRRLTKDHTLAGQGHPLAGGSPLGHIVTRALLAGPPPEAGFAKLDVEVSDVLLLVSDGVTNVIADSELETLLHPSADAAGANTAKHLCEAIMRVAALRTKNAVGPRLNDNATCVCVTVAKQ